MTIYSIRLINWKHIETTTSLLQFQVRKFDLTANLYVCVCMYVCVFLSDEQPH